MFINIMIIPTKTPRLNLSRKSLMDMRIPGLTASVCSIIQY